jgi:RNA polymerase sigma factor (TIGR02999 family)
MASRQMRRILIDYALMRKAQKRGGDLQKDVLDEERLIQDSHTETLLELDDALGRLAKTHLRQSQAVELRYFGGLTLEEAGEVLGVAPATVMRDLRFAEAWLAREWGGDWISEWCRS